MIPPKQVQEILDLTRIEEVIEDFVTLRRRGVNLIGLCPFHNEKSPSFNVNPTRNIFKCFGCGKGGDAVTFLMEHEHFAYPDALRWLARKYNVEIQEIVRSPEQVAELQYTDSLYIVNDFALQHFQQQLFDTDEGKSVALSYFKQRGLREETIRNFGLGYAPDQWDLLLKTAKSKGHDPDMLRKLGLVNQEATRDFFRARVMFAIHNLSGKVAAFAGRTMSSDKNTPKYINSPETEIYVKNKILYGAFQAKKAIRQKDECILVEGYMDVISLHQAGIENVVASSGTSLTEGQLQLIKRNTNNLKILYDGDPAGIKAALRGLDLALEQDMNVRIVLLPDKEDPDSYVQKYGGEAFTEFTTRESKDFILFKTQLLLAETKGDPIKKSILVKDIVASIAKIPDPIKRSLYLRECSALMEVDENALVSEINKLIQTALKKKADKDARSPSAASDSPDVAPNPEFPTADPALVTPRERPVQKGDEFQERDIVRLLVLYGEQMLPKEQMTVAAYILLDIEESLDTFDFPLYGRFAREYHQMIVEGKSVDRHHFLNHENPQICELTVNILSTPWEMSPNWEERFNNPLQNQPMPDLNFDIDARQALDRFKLRKLMKMCEINLVRIRAASEAGDMDTMMHYMRVQQKLNESRNELAARVGTVVLSK
ncbi:MAG: DNA primase [Saprospiraceae bacterium]|nr:DNA primase [Saprospiraceae bacterium]